MRAVRALWAPAGPHCPDQHPAASITHRLLIGPAALFKLGTRALLLFFGAVVLAFFFSLPVSCCPAALGMFQGCLVAEGVS